VNVKGFNLTREQISEYIAYDPDTGRLTWIKSPARRIKAGDEAGIIKTANKAGRAYRYVGFKGYQLTAGRLAWLLHYGEWPVATVSFIDDDTLNTRIDNLRLAMFPSVKELKGGRRSYKMSREAQRHYGLKRYYGLTGEQYGEMLAAQKGLCAICGKPETAMINGTPKVMHVDHDHDTDDVRGLLCGSCNGGLGLFKDDPAILRAAADYIDRHRAKVIPLQANGVRA